MSTSGPTVSLVVISRDDRGLRDTLGALARASAAGGRVLETIVVDASAGRLDDIRAEFPAVRWIVFPPRAGKPTIPEQRNAGVGGASGEVVVFTDASCVPSEGWLSRLLAPIAAEGEAIVAGGVRSTGRPGLRDEAAHFLGGARYLREAPTINLAVARRVFDAVGTFDERFAYGSDADFTWRAVDAGYRIRYEPAALVSHDWGGALAEARRSYRYGQARLRLYAKHRGRRRRMLADDPIAVVYPLLLLALPALACEPVLAAALLAVPLVKNAGHRPLLTLADHLLYGAGVLSEAWRLRAR